MLLRLLYPKVYNTLARSLQEKNCKRGVGLFNFFQRRTKASVSLVPHKPMSHPRSHTTDTDTLSAESNNKGKVERMKTTSTATQLDKTGNIGRSRRRLTLAGANVLLDGVASMNLAQSPGNSATPGTAVQLHGRSVIGHVFGKRFGICNKGYAPYNPAKKNQDSMIMSEDPKTGALFVGVLDGHGEVGHHVSQYFRDRLPKMLFSHPKFPSNCGAAMSECIVTIEKAMLSDRTINSRFSGSTCVLATILGNQLTCANIGDSRVILGRRNTTDGTICPVEVSRDHKPDCPDEKARIEAKGGRVFAITYEDGIDGPPRVWLSNMDVPGLAMSRSLGDTVGHDAGIISTPEITNVLLTSEHDCLIMASDGLWEFIENDECLKMAYQDHCAHDPKVRVVVI